MAKASPIQSNFNVGEISPLLYGRVDLDAYKSALAVCLNCLPTVEGPATRRPGSYFSDEVKDSTKKTRVMPFRFSTTQAYIIEFGDLYVRFKRNNGPVRNTAQNITAVTKANPGVLTYNGSDTYANGDHVDVAGVVGMTELNGRRFKVANVATGPNTFELQDVAGVNVDTSAFTTYTSGGTIEEVYEIATPYLEADLFQLKITQSTDVLYIYHPGYAPRKLTRTAHTSWTLTQIVFLDGPYMNVNATDTTLTPSSFAVGTGVTLTASAVTGINDDQGFLTTDVGRLIRIDTSTGGTWGYVRITAHTSTTVVTVEIIITLTNNTARKIWRMGLWSDTTGYPAVPVFSEDRLVSGGNTSAQQRIDGSRTGDYENMAPSDLDGTITDRHAYSFTLNSEDVQVVRWMKNDEKALFVGTVEGEWPIRPSSDSQAISPTNVNAKQSTPHGSINTQAVKAGKAILFIQKSGRKLRKMTFNWESDGFSSPNMTRLAEHITKGPTAATSGIKELAWQQDPQPYVWGPRNDGVLLSLLFDQDEQVMGWSRHILGGYSDSGKTTAAVVESVAVIPAADGTRDELWMVVQRYINGRLVRYIEYLTKAWEQGDTQSGAIFGDCALTYNGVSTKTITGLFHLAGETVSILADGATHPDKTVSATGTITLDRNALIVQVGYSYNSDGQTLRQEAGASDGTAQGKTQRANRATFRFHDTGPVKLGASFKTSGLGKLTVVPFRKSTHLTATAVPLFSDDLAVSWEGDYTTSMFFCWRWDTMLPGTILAVMPQFKTEDRG